MLSQFRHPLGLLEHSSCGQVDDRVVAPRVITIQARAGGRGGAVLPGSGRYPDLWAAEGALTCCTPATLFLGVRADGRTSCT